MRTSLTSFAAIVCSLSLTPARAQTPVTWVSSVDGESVHGKLYTAEGFNPDGDNVPLIVFFGGGSGNGLINDTVVAGLKHRGWIGLGLAGRDWDLEEEYGCTYPYSMGYFDHEDEDIGPGRQDVLDGLDHMLVNYPVDPERIYLSGFSLGGRGAYIIGLTAPDRFAAMAAFAPAVDQFEIDIRTSSTRPSYPCRMALAGEVPGTSDLTATRRSTQSARFLIENAYNLPVFHGHGTADPTAMNNLADAPYMHGRHLVNDASFEGCHQSDSFCFGHTPTIAELHQRHPDGYPFAYMFTDYGHHVDPRCETERNRNRGTAKPRDGGIFVA